MKPLTAPVSHLAPASGILPGVGIGASSAQAVGGGPGCLNNLNGAPRSHATSSTPTGGHAERSIMARKRNAPAPTVKPEPQDVLPIGLSVPNYPPKAVKWFKDSKARLEASLAPIVEVGQEETNRQVAVLRVYLDAAHNLNGGKARPSGKGKDEKAKTYRGYGKLVVDYLFRSICLNQGIDPDSVGRGKAITNRKDIPGWSTVAPYGSIGLALVSAPSAIISVEDLYNLAGVHMADLTPVEDWAPVPGAILAAYKLTTNRAPKDRIMCNLADYRENAAGFLEFAMAAGLGEWLETLAGLIAEMADDAPADDAPADDAPTTDVVEDAPTAEELAKRAGKAILDALDAPSTVEKVA